MHRRVSAVNKSRAIGTGMLICASLPGNMPAFAGDWGYDAAEAAAPGRSLEPQSAGPPAKMMPAKAAAAEANTSGAKIHPGKNSDKARTSSTVPPKSGEQLFVRASKTATGTAAGKPGANPLTPLAPYTIPTSVTDVRKERSSNPADTVDAYIDKDQQAVRCWLQLFQSCAKQKMDYPQQKLMEAYMLGRARLAPKQDDELRAILKFWPKLINDLRDRPEMEMHYADLFRALLRLHERSHNEKTNVEGSQYGSDGDLITELLGLQRTAVAGDPPFTEDAVNAYADMAVFIYEQQHAGRTIDANDNRALFAKVVAEKFKQAPTAADRRAMSAFDIAWAKFKIIWFNSPEKIRQVLLDKLVKSGANSTLTVTKDPLLELVLANWPFEKQP